MNFLETPDIDTSSDSYAMRFSGRVGAWFLAVQEEATLRMLSPYSGAKVLDVGGGHGQLTETLIRHGYQVTVLGSDEKCKRRIQALVDQNRCTFKVGNILDLPFHREEFDIVISYRLLSHVVQWKLLISEFARIAKKAVLIDYPTARSINYMAPIFFQLKKRIEGNTRFFTVFKESEIIQTFKSCQFIPAERFAEFCLPMVFYRAIKSPRLAFGLEKLCRVSGLTHTFGSPVILKVIREAS